MMEEIFRYDEEKGLFELSIDFQLIEIPNDLFNRISNMPIKDIFFDDISLLQYEIQELTEKIMKKHCNI